MLPEQPISFPEFVADQLLTAANLNDLFHYLDVQERGTRTNLIGIGIVCGLELKVNNTGAEVTITKGCGITSQGYLVRWNEMSFQNYKAYDAAKEKVYAPFYANGQQKFDIDELKANASEEGITKLTSAYLADKVALLFVELLDKDAKNCDPESCDDKGKNVTLTIRPLLVKQSDAVNLTGGVAGTNAFNQSWITLPELKMPRHHIPADDVFDSGDVFAGFQKVLSASFLGRVEEILTVSYQRLQPLVADTYSSNPFDGIADDFAFVHNGAMSAQQLLYMQYYYDLFGDVIYAYEELCKVGMRLLSLCCPDENLFPRHLLLGVTGTQISNLKVNFRHYFIPSPAVGCHSELVSELRLLFKRIVLLLDKFNLPPSTEITGFNRAITNALVSRTSTPIRITPSKLGDVPLSEKAIPYYYDVASGADKLFQNWNFQRSRNGSADQILSYNASQYNNSDDEVLHAIQYDLEPYNFLRIEGHVGHKYTDALATINQIRDANRLPFDVIALSADVKTLREILAGIATATSSANLRQGLISDISLGCHFQDLEALYDTMAQGLICNLCKEMKYYYGFPVAFRDTGGQTHVPQVPLLKKCDPSFRYLDNTLGDAFEDFYKSLPSGGYIEPAQFLGGTAFGNYTLKNLSTNTNNNGILLGLALLYYIEKLSEILTTTLISFNISAFQTRYADLMTVAMKVKEFHAVATLTAANEDNELAIALSEDIIDHIDSLLLSCRDAQFNALYSDYRIRWVYLAMLQKLGYYVKMHPGIQHKAGVTTGGTFILVYHEQSRANVGNRNIFTNAITAKERVSFTTAQEASVLTRAADISNTAKTTKAQAAKKTEEPAEAQASAAASAENIAGQTMQEQTIASDVYLTTNKTTFKTTYQLSTAKLKTILTQQQFSIIDKLFFKEITPKHTLDELTAQLADKIVIADFYLPYMCCSDCPPVYYIVNEPEETAQVTVSIKDTQYCNADAGSYTLTVSPAGGSFGNSEGVTAANGVFSFKPSAVVIPEGSLSKVVQLTYTKDGESASVSVTVFAKPAAALEVVPATTYNFFVFHNKSTNAVSVAWDFGDGITATGDNPTHTYAQDGTYTVKLTATNGVCTDVATEIINVVKATISLDGNQFCSADKSAYPVLTSPEGGVVTGEGISKAGDSSFQFKPAAVTLSSTQSSKDVQLSYSVGSQLAQNTVKVFQTPSAAFTVSDNAASANIKSFKTGNTFPAQYFWDFGDGKTSVEATPTHQYDSPGDWVVTLNVSNGPCQAQSSQTITIAQASVSITPTDFCSADTQSYPVTVSPAGGTLSGEGIIKSGNAFTFRPNLVALGAEQAQKVITLVYSAGSQSAQTQVVVFHTPDASFVVTPTTASPTSCIFSTNVGFGASFAWDFGDGSNSTAPNPTHTYKQAGVYTVTVKVTNGKCSASSSQQITMGSVKTCGPLADAIAAFGDLESVSAAQFKNFRNIYKSYADVESYFKELSGIAGNPVADQLKFFVETGVADRLMKWLTELANLVTNSDVRLVAIAMWRVLTMLAMYVMCIQDGDFKENEIDLTAVFDFIERSVKTWKDAVANFNDAELAQLQKLLDTMTAERDRVVSNGEQTIKATYFAKLNNIITVLKSYL